MAHYWRENTQIAQAKKMSLAYSDLLHLERKVDYTIMRKRLEMQESLKRPQKIKKKLRLFITNSFYPANPQQANSTGNWELRVEGRLLEQEALNRLETN